MPKIYTNNILFSNVDQHPKFGEGLCLWNKMLKKPFIPIFY